MTDSIDPAPEAAQVKVIFTTTESDIQLPESKRQLLVPADIRRYGLSRILNSGSMLATDRAIPFDFLVDGVFLRATLADYLREQGLSAETTITLQYVRSLIPPVFEASFQHDDWVSAVDVSPAVGAVGGGSNRLLSGSYDGLLRLWNAAGHVTTVSPDAASGAGHTSAVKAARFVTPTQIASAGLDRTVRIWNYATGEREDQAVEEDHAGPQLLKPTLVLYGHKGSVDRLAVDTATRRVLTASIDGCVGLWSTSKTSAPAPPAGLLPGAAAGAASTNKKRKVATPAFDIPHRGPLALVHAHKAAPAAAAIFDPRDRTVAYSAGHDHALCTLDLTTGQVVTTVATSHALLALCAVGGGGTGASTLLAAGNAARNIVLVDPRVSVATTAVMTLRGHTNKVVAVAASPAGSNGGAPALVSGSHDGTCRIWDLRNGRRAMAAAVVGGDGANVGADGPAGAQVSEAVYTIDREGREGQRRPLAGEGVKVFDVVWDATWGIVSGGEDKRVQINRGRDVFAQGESV
ncbi:microtubule associated protein [Niveomyces insectorum RCEF 264]|uniref:Ribosome biogenesis protein YTM1 n=1 Tax=Niveomyces insectorum RCEF 264 TaxID=1081102 RepID=A0A162MCT8_9HYPO|nr:microtubule associated protein [Niveomyces insectorum RCEF 264]